MPDGRLASLVADTRFFWEWREKVAGRVYADFALVGCPGGGDGVCGSPTPAVSSRLHMIVLKGYGRPAYKLSFYSLYPSVPVPTPPPLSYPSPFRLSRDVYCSLIIYPLLSFPLLRSFDIKYNGAQCSSACVGTAVDCRLYYFLTLHWSS